MTGASMRCAKHLDGWFFNTCPDYLLVSPAVQDVAALYGWRSDGCLQRSDLNVPQRRAVEAFARGVAAAQSDRLKEGSNGKGSN